MGPRTHGRALAVGATLGLLAWVPLIALGDDHTRAGAVLLAAISGVYFGFAVADGRPSALGIESLAILVFIAVAYIGIDRGAGWLIGLGFLGHAAWDWLHHSGRGPTVVKAWYPPFCAIADVIIAIPLLAGIGQ